MSHQEQHLTYIPLEEGRTFRVLSDIMTFKLGRADTQGAFFLCFDQVPPQGGAAMHRQQGQETFVIFEGELEFSTQDESETSTFTASRGAVVHVPAGIAHAYANISTVPASMLVIFTPAGLTERFFEQIGIPVTDRGNLPPPAFPDPERVQTLLQEHQVQLVMPPSLNTYGDQKTD